MRPITLDPSRTGREADRLLTDLRRLIVGQDEAVQQIVDTYQMQLTGMSAQGRPIGILVMEIAGTDAASEEDAAQKAAAIRKEVESKIPSLESLFVTTAGE